MALPALACTDWTPGCDWHKQGHGDMETTRAACFCVVQPPRRPPSLSLAAVREDVRCCDQNPPSALPDEPHWPWALDSTPGPKFSDALMSREGRTQGTTPNLGGMEGVEGVGRVRPLVMLPPTGTAFCVHGRDGGSYTHVQRARVTVRVNAGVHRI